MSDVIRPAATVLLLRDDPFRVLMVTRGAAATFGSRTVFPGGAVDADDHADAWLARSEGGAGMSVEDRAYRIAAIRETWEEVGLLVAPDTHAGHDRAEPFAALVDRLGLRLPLDRLTLFSHWITGTFAPKRFDTRFFLCPAPDDQDPVCAESEVYRAEWVEPSVALAMGASGERSIILPTRLNLQMLAESRSIAEAEEKARARTIVPILPRLEEGPNGREIVIREDAGYGATRFATAAPA